MTKKIVKRQMLAGPSSEKRAFMAGYLIANAYDMESSVEAYNWWMSLPRDWLENHPMSDRDEITSL